MSSLKGIAMGMWYFYSDVFHSKHHRIAALCGHISFALHCSMIESLIRVRYIVSVYGSRSHKYEWNGILSLLYMLCRYKGELFWWGRCIIQYGSSDVIQFRISRSYKENLGGQKSEKDFGIYLLSNFILVLAFNYEHSIVYMGNNLILHNQYMLRLDAVL